MKLVIIHNHFRPGGVRRVIELATPHVVQALRPGVKQVLLATGEAPEETWLRQFRARLKGVEVACAIEPAFLYVAEQRRLAREIARDIRRFLAGQLPGAGADRCIVWAHNQGLGRNLLLTRELVQHCDSGGVSLVWHHHDWWFDNRWQRWEEIRRAEFHSLQQVAETVFSSRPCIRMIAINEPDARVLERYFPGQAGWIPNPAETGPAPEPGAEERARRWLHRQIGEAAPVWLMPCRLVRRKNIAEALLLMRWLRPEAWLVTTGGVSSKDELAYSRCLDRAVRRHGWRLRLAVLQEDEATKPRVGELMAASEAILLTSLQEGFGLPYLEAASARRPLIARSLPNMRADLEKFGFRFPHTYNEVMIAPGLFDWTAEQRRQSALFQRWRGRLPRSCLKYVGRPLLLSQSGAPRAIPFSRLTLAAQLEVLAWPAEKSFALCAPLNPGLVSWRAKARVGKLGLTPWPASAARWLSGPAYGRRFRRVLAAVPGPRRDSAAPRLAQEQFLRSRLASENLYPLLWSTGTR